MPDQRKSSDAQNGAKQPEDPSLHLVADNLTIERGGRLVINNLSFTVPAGTALILTGPNGIGKSTLLRTLAGLIRPVKGQLALEGADPDGSLGEQCHYFGHNDAIKTALTVAENVSFWQAFYGMPQTVGGGRAGDSVVEALGQVGLDRLMDLPAAYLSAGQRRRLSFARLLASSKPVWLLDEPTSALDASAEERFVHLMNQHLSRNGIIIAATHTPITLIQEENAVPPIHLRLGTAEGTVA